MPKKTTSTPRKTPIGSWVYLDSEREKARFTIAANRSPAKSISRFFQAAAETAIKVQEKKLGPITEQMIDEYLTKGRHANGKSNSDHAAV